MLLPKSTENKMDKKMNREARTYYSKCVISSKAKWLKIKISKSNFANGVLRRGSKTSVLSKVHVDVGL